MTNQGEDVLHYGQSFAIQPSTGGKWYTVQGVQLDFVAIAFDLGRNLRSSRADGFVPGSGRVLGCAGKPGVGGGRAGGAAVFYRAAGPRPAAR